MKIQISGTMIVFSILAGVLSASAESADDLKDQLAAELRKIEAINEEIEEVQAAIKKAIETPPEKSVEVVKEVAPEVDSKEEALNKVFDLENRVQRNATLLEAYRNGYHVSSEIPVGTALGNLNGPNGLVYENASLLEVNRDGLKIKHANGMAIVPGTLLPQAVLEKVDVPPHSDDLAFDVFAVFETKPDGLKSKETIKMERDLARDAKRTEERRKYEETLALNKERRAGRMAAAEGEDAAVDSLKAQAIADRNKHVALNEEKRQMLFKRRELQREISTLEKEVATIRRGFEQKRVKADKKTVDAATFSAENKIEGYQAEVKALDVKIEAILKEIRVLLNP